MRSFGASVTGSCPLRKWTYYKTIYWQSLGEGKDGWEMGHWNWGCSIVCMSWRSSLEIKIGFYLPGKRILAWWVVWCPWWGNRLWTIIASSSSTFLLPKAYQDPWKLVLSAAPLWLTAYLGLQRGCWLGTGMAAETGLPWDGSHWFSQGHAESLQQSQELNPEAHYPNHNFIFLPLNTVDKDFSDYCT